MFKFIILSAIVAVATSQGQYNKNPKTAAILSEQRYLSGDGQFGAAYTQEDGTDFKEETDADGTRHGSYSYIDPTGQKRTISYTAGKNGFQATGDDVPVAPPAPPQPIPQQQYQPQPQFQNHQRNINNDNFDDGQYDPRYNDPNYSGNPSQVNNVPHNFAPAPQPQQQQQQQYQQRQQQNFNAPPPSQYNYNSAPQQPQPQYNPVPQQQQQQQQQNYNQYTTQSPNRFQPPGKLSLNRTPDGFSYSFNKV